MTLFADLHLHSKYARATSINMDLEHITRGARDKGLGLVGTGDFTHPTWFKELKSKLEESPEGSGFFSLKGERGAPKFMLQVEVATFKSTPKKVRKVHHVICVSSFDEAQQLNDLYSKWGNLAADGRPMFGNRPCAELVEKTKQLCPKAVVFPAHSWTPWFGVFGSESGFDSLEEAYEDQVKHVFCYETGMSADPGMCWRLSKLDSFTPVSFSDSHSFWPWRLGRECNAFSDEVSSFDDLWTAVKKKDSKKFLFTVETDPAYGKYHWDGHRNCNFSCSPAESRKLKGICPVCKRPLTIGVEYRVEQLADRPEGFVPKGAIPFKKLLPLHELLATVYCTSLSSKKVMTEGTRLMNEFSSELNVLLEASRETLLKTTDEKIVDAILLNREAKIKVKPGFDGEYGVPQLPQEALLCEKPAEEKPRTSQQIRQKSLGDW
ncbi:DNA helicase UvrD [Candidatus Micrarchaeota archaeon]|nr:DNA helicase UvrD [Candidatus Micrarchaeota archaeon]